MKNNWKRCKVLSVSWSWFCLGVCARWVFVPNHTTLPWDSLITGTRNGAWDKTSFDSHFSSAEVPAGRWCSHKAKKKTVTKSPSIVKCVSFIEGYHCPADQWWLSQCSRQWLNIDILPNRFCHTSPLMCCVPMCVSRQIADAGFNWWKAKSNQDGGAEET